MVFPLCALCINCRVCWSNSCGHSESTATLYSELHMSTSREMLTFFSVASDTLPILSKEFPTHALHFFSGYTVPSRSYLLVMALLNIARRNYKE
jgi:hypothetical protein